MINPVSELVGSVYQNFAKDLLFKLDPHKVHSGFVNIGYEVGQSSLIKQITSWSFRYDNKKLTQKIAGVEFPNPIGLAAGFDYEAKLTQVLPSIGFGFSTVGSITYQPYQGNPLPMLGRLPKSQSLMVNKGFKNEGIKKVLQKLKDCKFSQPVGISIGKTNTLDHKTQVQAVADIIASFKLLQKSRVPFSYYELNISCPNLMGTIEFYSAKNLAQLLGAVAKLKLAKPIFIKMPINKTDPEILQMLRIITKYPIAGVILGNLQKDRKNKTLVKSEVANFPVGNFSGKPCQRRSNELIKLAYQHYKNKLIIIGCGGVFSAQDAYKKIRLGASLVQLITGMIFMGPQLPGQINLELANLLKKDDLNNISEAIGLDA